MRPRDAKGILKTELEKESGAFGVEIIRSNRISNNWLGWKNTGLDFVFFLG